MLELHCALGDSGASGGGGGGQPLTEFNVSASMGLCVCASWPACGGSATAVAVAAGDDDGLRRGAAAGVCTHCPELYCCPGASSHSTSHLSLEPVLFARLLQLCLPVALSTHS